MRLGAIVLAAGFSSRMGEFKPLIEVDGIPILLSEIDLLRSSGVEQVVVVSGYRHEDLVACLTSSCTSAASVQIANNPEYKTGMFSSVLAGVRGVADSVDAFFLLPSDCPGVSPDTLSAQVAGMNSLLCDVVYPVFNGRRGHPPLISARVIPQLLDWRGEGGLKMFLKGCSHYDLQVQDSHVLNDLDTPSELARYKGTLAASIR